MYGPAAVSWRVPLTDRRSGVSAAGKYRPASPPTLAAVGRSMPVIDDQSRPCADAATSRARPMSGAVLGDSAQLLPHRQHAYCAEVL